MAFVMKGFFHKDAGENAPAYVDVFKVKVRVVTKRSIISFATIKLH
jgi:hypothetical protein